RLHQVASDHPLTLDEASEHLWGTVSDATLRLMHWLVVLGARAVADPNSPPLLPARYHLFFRGLRGAAVCVSPKCPERSKHPETRWSSLYLEDRVTCPACDAHVLPLLTCVHCGAPVLRVFENVSGRWQTVMPGVNRPVHLLSWDTDPVQQSEAGGEDDDTAKE